MPNLCFYSSLALFSVVRLSSYSSVNSQLCAENSLLCLSSLLQIPIPASWGLIYSSAQMFGFSCPSLCLLKILLISSKLSLIQMILPCEAFHDSQIPRHLTWFLILDFHLFILIWDWELKNFENLFLSSVK